MQPIPAHFDGEKIVLEKKIALPKNARLLVFVVNGEYEDVPASEIAKLAEVGGAFDFLADPDEDIYSDEDLKVRYR
ncbi:hypothetical protein L0337_02225 [candidate division KSB1 bacterium]|nr:hypothetical protein [candidate division KSB1 bacterium]